MSGRQAGYRLLDGVDAEAVAARIIGPLAATDDGIVLFDGTSGKVAKDSGVTLSDLALVDDLGAEIHARLVLRA